jgi:hypothetical protein
VHAAHYLHEEPGRAQSMASEAAFQPSRRNSFGDISDMQESAMYVREYGSSAAILIAAAGRITLHRNTFARQLLFR